jgi:hypothetical protein
MYPNIGTYMFFGRPRRFGKSLLCNTLKCIYQGKKELFEGLYIYDKIDWEQIKRPVIHIDLSKVEFTSISLSEGLNLHMDELGEELNFTFQTHSAQSKLNEMIVDLGQQTGKNVVVIVDEYDKALTDVLEDEDLEKFERHKNILIGLYGMIKANDGYLHQVVFTGISSYGKSEVFSQLNNVFDYSLFKEYAMLLGFTLNELQDYFQPYLVETAKYLDISEKELLKAIRYKYEGFSFDGVSKAYNPFCMLNFLKLKQFGNYWFNTGNASLLIALLKQHKIYPHELEGFKISSSVMYITDIKYPSVISLLFQTGYLTIKETERDGFDIYHYLDFPNTEVKQAFAQYLLMEYTSKGMDRVDSYLTTPLRLALKKVDLDTFCKVLEKVYSDVPYQIYEKTEAYYHTIFHVTLNSIGLKTESEVQTNIGRIDSVVETAENIFIFEFKLDESKEEALAQIEKNKYYQKYQNQPLPIYAIGINFSSEKRNMEGWVVKKLK